MPMSPRSAAASAAASRCAACCSVHPDLLLLDEPTNHLDAESGGVARALPAGVQRHGRGHHPRPLLPRQRGQVDPRARSRPGHPLRGQLLHGWLAEAGTPGSGREEPRERRAQKTSANSSGSHVTEGPPGQGQGALSAYDRAAQAEAEAAERTMTRQAGDHHPVAGKRLGDNVIEVEGHHQGVRRSPADRQPLLQAAARRHRRHHRPQRRRQDHAVQDDHRARAARQGRRHDRRHGADRPMSTRAATALDDNATVWEEITGGIEHMKVGNREINGARLRGQLQLQGQRPAEEASATCPAVNATACIWPSC